MYRRWQREDGRYYLVHLHQDLFGTWVLTRAWGQLGSSRGQVRHFLLESEEHGRLLIDAIARRREQHGYCLSGEE